MDRMKLSSFQRRLLNEMEPDVLYDCDLLQPAGGRQLPDWFYLHHCDQNTDHMADINALVATGELSWQADQVLKPYMKELKRWHRFHKPQPKSIPAP